MLTSLAKTEPRITFCSLILCCILAINHNARAQTPSCQPVQCYENALQALQAAQAAAQAAVTQSQNLVSTLQKQVDDLNANVKAVNGQLGGQIAALQQGELRVNMSSSYVTPVAQSDIHVFTFPFNVADAVVLPQDNFSNMGGFTIQQIAGNNVTVLTTMHGVGGSGPGVVRYRVLATSK